MIIVAIVLGAIVGACGRYALARALHKPTGAGQIFPRGTLLANGIAGVIAGFAFAGYYQQWISEAGVAFLLTGAAGSLSTMSSFALEVRNFMTESRTTEGLGYLVITLGASLIGVCVGWGAVVIAS